MLDALYQDEIIQLSRQARQRGRLEAPDASARVDNPLCGDRVTMDLEIKDGHITKIGHRVRGCALCEAAAELIAENAVGLDVAALAEINTATRAYIASGEATPPWTKLSIFEPVRDVKSRHDCVYLPFTASINAFTEFLEDN